MTTSEYTEGAAVTINAAALGVCTDAACQNAVSHPILGSGDEAFYLGPHLAMAEAGWHVLRFERMGTTYYCPVHPSHFTVT